MTDAEIIGLVASRDRRAFDELYDRYAQIIFNLCIRILKKETDAQDVMQEIFVQVWRDAGRFDPGRASVKTWLFTIARSRSLDRYRSRKAVETRIEGSEDDLSNLPIGKDLQESSVTQQYVHHALSQLSGEQRLVLELSYYEGLTQEEIAEQLGEPLGTIKSRIRSALIKLRGFLAGGKSE